MKWVVLLIFIALVPIIRSWLIANPRKAPMLWTAFAFLPFVLDSWKTIIAPISWATWAGYSRGAEVSLLDFVAVAIILSRPPGSSNKFPLLWLWIVMVFAALLSAIQATFPMASFFVVWQLFRCALIFMAAAIIMQAPQGPNAILRGMVIGVCLNLIVAVEQKLSGTLQPAGLFRHQNMLGLVLHFVIYPCLAVALSTKKGWWLWLGTFAALILAVLTASRATIGLTGLGLILVIMLSLARQPTGRKAGIAFVIFVGLIASIPVSMSVLQNRLNASALTSFEDGEREAFKKAAALMLADHPMGVGANHYVYVANKEGYSERGGVIWNTGSRAAHVHQAFLLFSAETGYIGFIAFVLFMTVPAITALTTSWKSRSLDNDLTIGLAVSFFIVNLHSLFEWAIATYQAQVFVALGMGGVSAALSKYRRAGKARHRPPRTNVPLNTVANES